MANTWDTSFSTIFGPQSVSNGSSGTSSAVDQSGKTATEVVGSVDYGATVNEGVFIYILRQKIDGNYQDINDDPYGFEVPSAVSSTRDFAITVPGVMANAFKVLVTNDSGASVTVEIATKQAS